MTPHLHKRLVSREGHVEGDGGGFPLVSGSISRLLNRLLCPMRIGCFITYRNATVEMHLITEHIVPFFKQTLVASLMEAG